MTTGLLEGDGGVVAEPLGGLDDDVLLAAERRELEDQCLEWSRRCLGHLKVAEDSGSSAGVELTRQGVQLRDVERQLDGLERPLRSAAKDIRWLRGWWRKLSKSKRKKQRRQGPVDDDVPPGRTSAAPPHRTAADPPPSPGANDLDRMKAVMDRHLDDMIRSVAFLRTLADDLARELDAQDEVLTRVSSKTEDVCSTIQLQSRSLKQLL